MRRDVANPLPRPRRCRGQVMFIVLLGTVLLAGLVMYVINVGDRVTRKVQTQNAADSAAMAGASWMARSMNVVAMNNVAQTRMLALVPILDAFPLSAGMAHEEVGAWEQCLADQLRRGVPDARLRDGLESLRTRMARQRDILAPVDDLLNHSGFQMEEITTWSIRGHAGPAPHGRLWQAAEAMDEFSQVTASSAGLLSQMNASRFGEANTAEVAFVVPINPELPAARTSFNDFERPVKSGLIPDRAYPQRLGPYDRLFRWRDYRYRDIRERDRLVPGRPGHGAIRGSTGNVDVGGRRRGNSARGNSSNPNAHWSYRTIGRVLEGYSVYGPYTWMMRRIHGYAQGQWHNRDYYPGELADTYFHDYIRQIADIKLEYMWGSKTAKYLHYPHWLTDYPQARTLAAQAAAGTPGAPRITRTMYYLVEIRSRYPKGDPNYLSSGTYVTNDELPIAMWIDGWADAADWKIPQLSEWVWEDQYSYETTEDWDIGIRMQTDATGQPVWQKVYMIAQYVFGGIDVGGEVEITDPSNYSDRNDLPAPILMEHPRGDYDVARPHHDEGVRRDLYSYLGVASRPDTARTWPARFGSDNPFRGVAAVAQVGVFNTTSWDLWTQDWKAQLVPVTQWGRWMQDMEAGISNASETAGQVDPVQVRAIQEYLSKFDEIMVDQSLHH
ncbi:MAG TPA: pilus assembly protein TadG-related protein [Phycisphaerae bacterium]|nr:pilus assembly protein TadG-related protein [Phycisphaerae bacterium]